MVEEVVDDGTEFTAPSSSAAKDDDDDPNRAPSSSSNPKHKISSRSKNRNSNFCLQPQKILFGWGFDLFCVIVATMTSFKTKPFSIIQPIPITEIQRCNNNEIFHYLHLTKQKWLSPR
jgi:hypothetical protein